MTISVDVEFYKPERAALGTIGVGAPFVAVESYDSETPSIAMAIGLPDAEGNVPCLGTSSGHKSWLPLSIPASRPVILVDRMEIEATLQYS